MTAAEAVLSTCGGLSELKKKLLWLPSDTVIVSPWKLLTDGEHKLNIEGQNQERRRKVKPKIYINMKRLNITMVLQLLQEGWNDVPPHCMLCNLVKNLLHILSNWLVGQIDYTVPQRTWYGLGSVQEPCHLFNVFPQHKRLVDLPNIFTLWAVAPQPVGNCAEKWKVLG